MKVPRWLVTAWLLGATAILSSKAQTDAPPDVEPAFSPEDLPPVAAPSPPSKGRLKIEFSGGRAFNRRTLLDGLAVQVGNVEEFGLDDASAYDTAFFLESFYRKHGYSQVEVTFRILGPWNLQLVITEGPLTHLGRVTITGNTAFTEENILKYLLGPIRERFPRIRQDNRLPFVDSDIFSGADLVSRLYAAEGYLDAVVDPPEIHFNQDRTVAEISLNIVEGIQYRFHTVDITGPMLVPREELIALISEQTGGIFTEGRLAAAQRKLEDFYKQRGHFTASVEATADPETAAEGQVTAHFHVEPGPVYRFDGSTVAGTQGVKPSFIEKRLRRIQGKVYDPALIDRQFRDLIQTGLFRDLRIVPEAIAGDQVRLDVSVEEAKPRDLGLGLGYASFLGLIIDVSYRDRNILGTGRPLSVNLEYNQRGYNGELTYQDPWFLDSDYSLKFRVYALTTELKGYSKYELGVQPTLSRQLTDHWEVSAFAWAKYVSLFDVLIEPKSLVGANDYSVVSFGVSQSIDYRNNKAIPTRGFIITTSLDFAPNGIGQVSFFRGIARFSYYIPVTQKSSLALGARAGVVSPLSGGTLPIDERFFNGGATTVRSFSELTLGPKDDAGYPLGGEAFTVFNAEYTFPIWQDLHGAVFVDAGNVVESAGDFGLENMRYAVGAGLRYNLPIGALRLDYGLNPSPKAGEARGAFHFAIGVAF